MKSEDVDMLMNDLKDVFKEVEPYGLEIEVFAGVFEQLMEKFPEIKLDDIQEALAIGTLEWIK